MRRAAAAFAVVLGVLLLAGAAVDVLTPDRTTTAAPARPAAVSGLDGSIERAQAALERNPDDAGTWAVLGSTYVEKARASADPSYYPKADGALERSLEVAPDDNHGALTGRGALANARHEFPAAAEYARRSLAVNGYSATTYGVLTDALTQLGDYDGATAAVQRMLDLQPGVASFTRASYDLELHGRTDDARAVLQRALTGASDPADVAYCHTYLGELAFGVGDLDTAAADFAAGLASAPDDLGLLLGRARLDAARGRTAAAVAGYQRVVDLRPLPGTLVEYGQFLESLGRTDSAATQYALFEAAEQLFAANGVQDSLTAALLAADRGRGADAVTAARAEYAARRTIDSADAMAWALHAAGRDTEAVRYAREATELGTRNATFLYHRGVIESAVGDTVAARATLTRALETNPYFSPLSAPRARAALAALGGPT